MKEKLTMKLKSSYKWCQDKALGKMRNFKCCRVNGRAWRNGHFVSRYKAKDLLPLLLLGYSHFASRGTLGDFLFLSLPIVWKKKVVRVVKQLEILQVEMEEPRNSNKNAWNEEIKYFNLLSYFWRGCRVGCATGKMAGGDGSTWEVSRARKRSRKGLSPRDWSREQKVPRGGKGERNCATTGQCG